MNNTLEVLLLSFIGAFLLQFSQMTSLCYYGIYPLACLLAFICFNNIQKIEKSIESMRICFMH